VYNAPSQVAKDFKSIAVDGSRGFRGNWIIIIIISIIRHYGMA